MRCSYDEGVGDGVGVGLGEGFLEKTSPEACCMKAAKSSAVRLRA
jgi:hypothetical protein